MTLPNKTHQANTRARKAAQGLVRVEVWVEEQDKAAIKSLAIELPAQRLADKIWVQIDPGDDIQTKDQSDE